MKDFSRNGATAQRKNFQSILRLTLRRRAVAGEIFV